MVGGFLCEKLPCSVPRSDYDEPRIAERLVARHVRNLHFEINITAFTLGVYGGSVLLRNVDEFSPQYSATCLRLPEC